MAKNDEEIRRLSLPALEPAVKRARMSFVDESEESQVTAALFLIQCFSPLTFSFLILSVCFK